LPSRWKNLPPLGKDETAILHTGIQRQAIKVQHLNRQIAQKNTEPNISKYRIKKN
jgi:hypothetical protein